jgi:hypothetical protein
VASDLGFSKEGLTTRARDLRAQACRQRAQHNEIIGGYPRKSSGRRFMNRFALLLLPLLALSGFATPAPAAEVDASVYFEPPPTPSYHHGYFASRDYYYDYEPYEVRTYIRRDYYYRPRAYHYERDYEWQRPIYGRYDRPYWRRHHRYHDDW